MDHSSHTSASNGSALMPASDMAMIFFNSINTPLYSSQWTPSSTGAYAGSCIFLIILAIIFRVLLAGKHLLEQHWQAQAWKRRYIVVAGKNTLSEDLRTDPDVKTGVLSANGVEENVQVVHSVRKA